MSARSEPHAASRADAWYRQPVLWLGVLVFITSLAGCVWIIVVSARHADTPLPDAPHTVLGMPVGARSNHGPAS